MKHFLTSLSALALLAAASCAPSPTKTDGRAFGLHFDFHAVPTDTLIGSTLSEDDIREICELYRPDFIQVDSKGHPGWTSFPSATGNSVPGIKGNPLAVWRKVTKEEGVELYTHYSGVYDSRWCEAHPEDAVMRADGSRSLEYTRTNGNYVDELLIPNLKEIAGFGVDGIWIDGDCWGSQIDCAPITVEAFEKETGIDLKGKVPYNAEDPYIAEYMDYNRELFCRYLRHYVDEVHKEYPDFKIASNWAFTEHMPVPVCADVQFISGDLPWRDCIYWGRYSSRSAAMQNVPWDMMAWAFRAPGEQDWIFKKPVQLMQEGATVIALGGGYQIYVPQYNDGSPRMEELRKLAPVADFIHERTPWTFGGHPRPQVALLMSTDQRRAEQIASLGGDPDGHRGIWGRVGSQRILPVLSALTDAGHSVTLISEADLDHISDYPVVVVPQLFKPLEAGTEAALKAYEDAGGKVLKSDELGDSLPTALDSAYEPEVKLLSADGILEIIDFEKDGLRMVQLVNGNGQHHDDSVMTEDSIPSVRDIRLSISLPGRPRAIYLQPEGRRIGFKWEDGRAEVEIPEVPIHSTLVIR